MGGMGGYPGMYGLGGMGGYPGMYGMGGLGGTGGSGGSSTKQDPKELLRLNGRIQPTQAYLSAKDVLMLAFAIENRSVTPALMKSRIEKLTGDVEKSASVWNKG
jgi:hypothetical protein